MAVQAGIDGSERHAWHGMRAMVEFGPYPDSLDTKLEMNGPVENKPRGTAPYRILRAHRYLAEWAPEFQTPAISVCSGDLRGSAPDSGRMCASGKRS